MPPPPPPRKPPPPPRRTWITRLSSLSPGASAESGRATCEAAGIGLVTTTAAASAASVKAPEREVRITTSSIYSSYQAQQILPVIANCPLGQYGPRRIADKVRRRYGAKNDLPHNPPGRYQKWSSSIVSG